MPANHDSPSPVVVLASLVATIALIPAIGLKNCAGDPFAGIGVKVLIKPVNAAQLGIIAEMDGRVTA